ncbi:MAG TPA: NAD(P)-dependent alcohol dehydrogenase [Terracidiphilus sp.]|nr:NAD(P)-dependent alcohol dehydrogenase [Terracidiphilus sp.]
MQAIVYHRYGAPTDVLEFREIEKPTPGPGEVLIQVHAASVNPYDWHFVRGAPKFIRLFTGMRGPKSPRAGADAAGVVSVAGTGVTRFKPGDAVFGVCKGSFAEFALAEECKIALMPENASFGQAASVPIAGITALQGLRDNGRVKDGQRVLINGAAGGVGTFAVQIGKCFGAHVTGVCSTRNLELVKSIGADELIDYTRQDFTRARDKYDVIFDLVGDHPLKAMLPTMHRKGILVPCGGGGPERSSRELLGLMLGRFVMPPFSSRKISGVFAKINRADLEVLGGLIQCGKVKPVLDRSYALGSVSDALLYVESCHVRGKVTIAVR